MAGQKPDSDHPFGHGRIEYISGLLVSILIVLMGFELVKSSVSKIFHPEAPDYSPVIIGILVFSIVVKCYMALYNRRIGTRISSVAMKTRSVPCLGSPPSRNWYSRSMTSYYPMITSSASTIWSYIITVPEGLWSLCMQKCLRTVIL